MNIILQNYKNLLNNLLKEVFINKIDDIFNNVNDYSINNYINIISNFDSNLNVFLCKALKELFEQLDKVYKNSFERKCKYHIKDYKKRTIFTMFGEVTYYRTFYKSKVSGKCFCYIDRLLGLKKYDYFDPYIKSEVLDYVSDDNYSKTAKHVNSLLGSRISLDNKPQIINRQTVRNIVLTSKISKPKYEPKDNVEELYIMADEKWIPTQNNNRKKVMQKSIVVFDGFNKHGKRKSLNNKMTFSGRNDDFIYEAIDYIEKSYNVSNIKRFYMLGDGALWIDKLKYYFNYNKNIQIIQGLDHYHFKQCLWRILPKRDVYDALVEYVKKDDNDEFNRLIDEIIDCNYDRKEKILEYKKYIEGHWNNILNIFKYSLSCPMESQISHTFEAYFTSRPKGYNKETINKLIILRLLKKNEYNIKKLYLNNLNSQEIIDLNKYVLDFSIFDKKKTYTLLIKKIDTYNKKIDKIINLTIRDFKENPQNSLH